MKNYYSLFLINKILDGLDLGKQFIQLNLIYIYH